MSNTCSICGNSDSKTYLTFGKWKCKSCINKSKTGKVGNSGMIYNTDIDISSYEISQKDLCLVKVKKSDGLFVKWFIEHYPQSKGIVGRSMNYLIYNGGIPVGIIGFASPPLNYKKFNEYFNLDGKIPSEEAKLFLNNNVFRIVDTEKNLATRVLALARKTILKDYLNNYGQVLRGIVTFVEPPRIGALYKADNWDTIGETLGIEVRRRGEDWLDKQYIKTDNKKIIFGYRYKEKELRKI